MDTPKKCLWVVQSQCIRKRFTIREHCRIQISSFINKGLNIPENHSVGLSFIRSFCFLGGKEKKSGIQNDSLESLYFYSQSKSIQQVIAQLNRDSEKII